MQSKYLISKKPSISKSLLFIRRILGKLYNKKFSYVNK